MLDQQLADMQRDPEQHRCPKQRRDNDSQRVLAQIGTHETAGSIGRQSQSGKEAADQDHPEDPLLQPGLDRLLAMRWQSAPDQRQPRRQPTQPVQAEISQHDPGIQRGKGKRRRYVTLVDLDRGKHGRGILQDKSTQHDGGGLQQRLMAGPGEQRRDRGAEHTLTVSSSIASAAMTRLAAAILL